jgi:hypothetical protein
MTLRIDGAGFNLGLNVGRNPFGVLDELSIDAVGFYGRRGRVAASEWLHVRRSVDNAYAVIGFTANGEADTAALMTFAQSGSVYVSILYDTSGLGNHFTQPTPTNQPLIVIAGVLVTQNGRPAIVSQNANQYMTCTTGTLLGSTVGTLAENFVSLVARADGAISHSIISNDSPGSYGHGIGNASGGAFYAMQDRAFFTGSAGSFQFSVLTVVSTAFSTTKGNKAWVNGGQVWNGGNDSGNGGAATVTLFGFKPGVRPSFPVYLSEMAITKTALSTATRQALERNQGQYFGIAVA